VERAGKDEIIITGAHHMLRETTVGSGDYESRADPHPAPAVRLVIVIAACSSGLPAFGLASPGDSGRQRTE
jgi:hypothetical protein